MRVHEHLYGSLIAVKSRRVRASGDDPMLQEDPFDRKPKESKRLKVRWSHFRLENCDFDWDQKMETLKLWGYDGEPLVQSDIKSMEKSMSYKPAAQGKLMKALARWHKKVFEPDTAKPFQADCVEVEEPTLNEDGVQSEQN